MEIFTLLRRATAAAMLATGLLHAPSASAQVGVDYIQGTVIDLSSTSLGVLIRLDSGRPSVCDGTPFAWMLIKAEHKWTISTVLMMYAMGKRSATVYVVGRGTSGFCEVDQYDPVE